MTTPASADGVGSTQRDHTDAATTRETRNAAMPCATRGTATK